MADWYCSSAAYAAVPVFVPSGVYTVGQFARATAAPNVDAYFVFRCTTAGTASTEPNWRASAPGNNATVVTGGATFTNVTGQSAYGWSAAAGTIYCLSNGSSGGGRLAAGDRLFASSDHTETVTTNVNYGFAANNWGLVQLISVNRAGSVPPVAADATSGAAVGSTSSNLNLDANCPQYWQGFTFSSTGAGITFNPSSSRSIYLRNCALFLNNAGTGSHIQTSGGTGRVTWDNTTVQFGNVQQYIHGNNGWSFDLDWRNTPSAIAGATIPTSLFVSGNSGALVATCRGVDLSALTTTLHTATYNTFSKLLLDSCRIASGLTRNSATLNNGGDEIELVNCYNGTVILSERYQPGGNVTTDRSTTMVGGAQDDVGLFSHKLVSGTNVDQFSNPLNSFWFDVENTLTGASHTATVEIVSSASLNNTDISLQLEYLGTSGSSLASFATSLPSALTASAALSTSTATWNSPPATPVYQHLQVTFTPQTAGRLRAQVRLGKASTTVWINPQVTVT